MKRLASCLFLALVAAPPPATAGPVEAFDWMMMFHVAAVRCERPSFNPAGISHASTALADMAGWDHPRKQREVAARTKAHHELHDEDPESFCQVAQFGVNIMGEQRLRNLRVID